MQPEEKTAIHQIFDRQIEVLPVPKRPVFMAPHIKYSAFKVKGFFPGSAKKKTSKISVPVTDPVAEQKKLSFQGKSEETGHSESSQSL